MGRCQGCVLSGLVAGGVRTVWDPSTQSLQHLGPNVISFYPCFANEETEPQKGGVTSSQKLVSGMEFHLLGTPWPFQNSPFPALSLQVQTLKEPTPQGQSAKPGGRTPKEPCPQENCPKSFPLDGAKPAQPTCPLQSPAVGIRVAAGAQDPIPPEDRGRHQGKAPTFRPVDFWGSDFGGVRVKLTILS